ncbi:SDR family NAD(P)-dependent oxidoreductase [Acetobacter senegalensis]|uniref:type I polyketide synthase n=1 Tax=Acetobacter senegalensis TaxID=446692 RepID=UPI001EDBE24F|nr:SDR family NAD(P)-dependent oxidoreductase [Acetobacter senegalensis]
MKKKQEFAIIGAGLRFPKNINDFDTFWEFLKNGEDASDEIPSDRWSINRFYNPEYEAPGKTYMRRGSFLTQKLGYFDPQIFGISPREAILMDPQQRLLLETTWEALENAFIIPSNLNGSKTGVFIGSFSLDWLVNSGSPLNRNAIKDHFSTTAASATMISARLSHVFGLCGPCLTIDTACSSSLVAIHNACVSLSIGESDMVIAGGVNFMINPQAAMPMSRGHFLAQDGRSKSFSADADGYGRGEGAAVLVIKRLEDALEAADSILGVICSSGVNHDGRATAITVPNGAAQEALIKDVVSRGALTPAQLDYVEAHGTGTPVGDPIETAAIGRAIGLSKSKENPLIIASVKANIGHLEAAAGVAGVLKTMLCLQNREIPVQANLERINSNIDIKNWNIRIPQKESIKFSSGKEVVYAGINSFGYGGTNAMVVMRSLDVKEADLQEKPYTEKKPLDCYFLPVSSAGAAGLASTASTYLRYLKDKPSIDIRDISYSLGAYRSWFQNRAIVLASTRNELLERLAFLRDGKSDSNVVIGKNSVTCNSGPVMVFSGMGSQWQGMGKFVLEHISPDIQNIAEEFDRDFYAHAGWSILEFFRNEDTQENSIHKTEIAQPAICLIEIIIFKTLEKWGITPAAIIGHSVGEVAAAYCSGALSLKDTVKVIYVRSRLQARLSGKGTMLAVGEERGKLEEFIIKGKFSVSIAAINSSKSCTLSGVFEDLEKIETHYNAYNKFARFLNVEVPYHSVLMEEIQTDMLSALSDIKPSKPNIPLYSTVSGMKWQSNALHDASYWYNNSRAPVEFFKAVTTVLDEIQSQVFLEIGAHPVLLSSIKEITSKSELEIQTVHSLRRNETSQEWISPCLARLAVAGCKLDWELISGGRRVAVPTYSWNREYFWSECKEAADDRLDPIVHPLLGLPVSSSVPSWRAMINQNYLPWLPDHCIENNIVLPASAYIEAALAVHDQLHGQNSAILQNFEIHNPLLIGEKDNYEMEWQYDPDKKILKGCSANQIAEEENSLWRKHVSVEVMSSTPWEISENRKTNQNEIKEFDNKFFYENLSTNGLQYGKKFQVVKNIWAIENGVGAQLSLDLETRSEVENYNIHPALLDGAFQAIAATVFDNNPDNEQAFVPVRAERIIYYGLQCSDLNVFVELKGISDKKIISDLKIYNENKEPVLCIDKMIFNAVPRLTKKKQFESLLYKTNWQNSEKIPLLIDPVNVLLIGQEERTTLLKNILEQNLVNVDFINLDINSEKKFYQKFFKDRNINEYKTIVFLCPLAEDIDVFGGLAELLGCVQALPQISSDNLITRLCIVTSGGVTTGLSESTCSRLDQAAYRGFARGVELERPDLRVKIIDLGMEHNSDTFSSLSAELLNSDWEDDVALHCGERLLARVSSASLENKNRKSVNLHGRNDLSSVLTVSITGSLEKLYYETSSARKPNRGEVACQVLAAALNFKDVLKAMNLLPESIVERTFYGNSLGMEAVVRITDIGMGVEQFVVGKDYIVAVPDCFATSFTVDADTLFAIEKPEGLSALDAATLPVAFLTAWYAFSHLARLQPFESVLIHSATGGVGLAAIQVAKLLGARIFATAGTEEKRAYLRSVGCEHVWSSRTLEFAEGLRHITGGKGVDVVLNSLAGEAQAASLDSVAPLGRFIEIGKKDIIENSSLPMKIFNENISFFSVDLDRLLLEKPEIIRDILRTMEGMVEKGRLHALPSTVYPARETVDAFRFLSSAKHIGKVVIDYTDLVGLQGVEKVVAKPEIDPTGAYLISGGFGGLGLETAEWLLRSGAKTIVLTGRKASGNEVVNNRIEAWRKNGNRIEERYFDITHEKSLQDCIGDFGENLPPLKGVFHCASIFDDALIENITAERLRMGLGAKAEGARLLDALTKSIPLDFFVLFSSVTTLTGNIGQSAYIAANEVLNQICENRRKQNLAALSLNLGPIANVGILSRNQVAADALRTAGMNLLDIDYILHFLPDLIQQGCAQITVADIDWEQWFRVVPLVSDLSRFTAMHHLIDNLESTSETMVALLGLPEEDRLEFLIERLKSIIAKTLHLQDDAVDNNAKLSELGLDSLAGVELQTGIRIEFGIEVSAMMFSKDDSIRSLARKFYTQIQAKILILTHEKSV